MFKECYPGAFLCRAFPFSMQGTGRCAFEKYVFAKMVIMTVNMVRHVYQLLRKCLSVWNNRYLHISCLY